MKMSMRTRLGSYILRHNDESNTDEPPENGLIIRTESIYKKNHISFGSFTNCTTEYKEKEYILGKDGST